MAARKRGWRVYVLRCGDGTLYTGVTTDVARRLAQHGAGKGARYTRSRLPVELVHEERAPDQGAALRREAALKRLPRADKLALVASGAPSLPLRRARGAARAPSGPATRRPMSFKDLGKKSQIQSETPEQRAARAEMQAAAKAKHDAKHARHHGDAAERGQPSDDKGGATRK